MDENEKNDDINNEKEIKRRIKVPWRVFDK